MDNVLIGAVLIGLGVVLTYAMEHVLRQHDEPKDPLVHGPTRPAVCPDCDRDVLMDVHGNCVHCGSVALSKGRSAIVGYLQARKEREDGRAQA